MESAAYVSTVGVGGRGVPQVKGGQRARAEGWHCNGRAGMRIVQERSLEKGVNAATTFVNVWHGNFRVLLAFSFCLMFCAFSVVHSTTPPHVFRHCTLMDLCYLCLGCQRRFGHKTGLSNHQHACEKWKNFDGVAQYKRRRMEIHNMRPDSTHDIQPPSEVPGPAHPSDLPIEVCVLLST